VRRRDQGHRPGTGDPCGERDVEQPQQHAGVCGVQLPLAHLGTGEVGRGQREPPLPHQLVLPQLGPALIPAVQPCRAAIALARCPPGLDQRAGQLDGRRLPPRLPGGDRLRIRMSDIHMSRRAEAESDVEQRMGSLLAADPGEPGREVAQLRFTAHAAAPALGHPSQ
jgi:hypothetical protein